MTPPPPVLMGFSRSPSTHATTMGPSYSVRGWIREKICSFYEEIASTWVFTVLTHFLPLVLTPFEVKLKEILEKTSAILTPETTL